MEAGFFLVAVPVYICKSIQEATETQLRLSKHAIHQSLQDV